MKLREDYILPSFCSFVLTGVKGEEIYGAALRVYEPLSEAVMQQLVADRSRKSPRPSHDGALTGSVGAGVPAVGVGECNDGGSSASASTSTSVSVVAQSTSDLSAVSAAGDGNGNGNAGVSLSPLNCPKCICLLSHWPFYNGFATFLKQLYQISLSPSAFPIELVLGDFMCQIPFPKPGGAPIHYFIGK